MQNQSELHFYRANLIGDAHSDFKGSLAFIQSISLISAFLNWRFSCPMWSGTELTGRTSSAVGLMRCSAMSVQPRCASHIFCNSTSVYKNFWGFPMYWAQILTLSRQTVSNLLSWTVSIFCLSKSSSRDSLFNICMAVQGLRRTLVPLRFFGLMFMLGPAGQLLPISRFLR